MYLCMYAIGSVVVNDLIFQAALRRSGWDSIFTPRYIFTDNAVQVRKPFVTRSFLDNLWSCGSIWIIYYLTVPFEFYLFGRYIFEFGIFILCYLRKILWAWTEREPFLWGHLILTPQSIHIILICPRLKPRMHLLLLSLRRKLMLLN